MRNDVFSFATVRPPQRINPEAIQTKVVRAYSFSGNESSLHQELRKLRDSEDGRKRMEERAKKFVIPKESEPESKSEFVSSISDLVLPQGGDFSKLDRWLLSRKRPIDLEDLKNEIIKILGTDIVQLVESQDYKTIRRRVSDSLIAWMIFRTDDNRVGPQLIRAMRLFGLLERMAANDSDLATRGAIERALLATVVLPTDIFPLPEPKSEGRKDLLDSYEEEKKRAEEIHKKIENRMNRLKLLRAAADDLTVAYDLDLLDRRIAAASVEIDRRTDSTGDSAPTNTQPALMADTFLSEKRAKKLSNKTKEVLKELDTPLEHVDVTDTVRKIEKEIADTASSLYGTEGLNQRVKIGNMYVPIADITAPTIPLLDGFFSPTPINLEVPEPPVSETSTVPETVSAVRVLGMADLQVVKQEILKYEPGEVAHIENVLKGESKERKHRRLRRTEEMFVTETERIEETERDLQSTNRFELQQEAAKTISEDISIEAGVTATYWGPSVEVTASADFAYDRSTERSSRTATSYASEVTDRSVARLSERVREERTRRTLEEFEEINTHGIDNKNGDNGHVIGIYRWVDKVYKAQVLRYDKHLMLEFLVPEPAAFYRYALSQKQPVGVTIEEPEPPTVWGFEEEPGPFVPSGEVRPLKRIPLAPKYITPENYLYWVGKYQVSSVEPPPPLFKKIGIGINELPQNSSHGVPQSDSDSKLKVDAGYVAESGWVGGHVILHQADGGYPGALHVRVGKDGGVSYEAGKPRRPVSFTLSEQLEGEIPVTVTWYKTAVIGLTVGVTARRTDQLYQDWQIKTFNAIMTAYNELKSRYEEELRASQVQEGIAINGRNPVRNREIERTELKKAAISMLMGQDIASEKGAFGQFDAMKKKAPPYNYPEMDLKEAIMEGRIIQFFEQAFEWRHITYIFYPYFWSRKGDWPTILQLDDTDPLFANFLRAGAARIQVPVRHGYEDLINSYIAIEPKPANPWPSGEPPGVDEETYLSVVDELAEQLGRDFSKGDGTISIDKDARKVRGTDTNFTDEDIDREILVHGARYRIAEVASPTELTLTEDYRGQSIPKVPYSISEYKLVGEPWDVRIPTTLVCLQGGDDKLPDFTRDGA